MKALPRGYCDGCNRVAETYARLAMRLGRRTRDGKRLDPKSVVGIAVAIGDNELWNAASDALAPIAYEASGAPYNRGRKFKLCARCLKQRMGWSHWRVLREDS